LINFTASAAKEGTEEKKPTKKAIEVNNFFMI
jgi:hypothetical protein